MARKRHAESDGEEIIVQRPSKITKVKAVERRKPASSRVLQNKAMAQSKPAEPIITHKIRACRTMQQPLETGEAEHTASRTTRKKRSLKRSRDSDDEASTPRHKRQHKDALPSPAETPSRGTTKLFDQLQLKSSITPKKMSSTAYQTPPATPESFQEPYQDLLPKELLELVSMFAAIVNATSAQLAANVSAWRIDVAQLLSTATSAWGKRRIMLTDLLRVLPIARQAGFDFVVEDFGRAGVFMMLEDDSGQSSVLDSKQLRRDFEATLRTQWQRRTIDVTAFVEGLPKYEVKINESVRAAAPLFSRGQQRLADLKAAQSSTATPHPAKIASPVTTKSLNERGTSLLDRILTKQANIAAMPAGPTKAELERKSALYRVEEVSRVLDIMSGGKNRASFSMLAVVQQLQQSLRSPMSKPEITTCLGLMANEIMPSFVSIMSSGAMSGVVVTRNGKLGIADLKKRLADAGI